MELLEFRGISERWRGGAPIVCVGLSRQVLFLIDKGELSGTFGGYAVYRNDATEEEFVGVWGHRKASAFRHLLRERGATITVVKERPDGLRLKWTTSRSTSS